jgi:hypothetical protein
MTPETEVLHPAEIVPLPELEISRPAVLTAIEETEKDNLTLASLRPQAESIQVVDVATYSQLGSVLTQVRLVDPASHWSKLDTFIKKLRAFYDMQVNRAKNERTLIEDICKKKLKAWEQRELPAAEAEEKQVNKAREKQGLPPVEVKPNLPSIGGYRRSTIYKATFDKPSDFDKLLKAWKNAKNKAVWVFYRQFITFDAKRLNEEAREVKDPKALAKAIPGCRAWQE